MESAATQWANAAISLKNKVNLSYFYCSMVSTAARVYTHQPQTMVHSDEELDVRSLETGNREYDNVRSSVQDMECRRTSIDSVNDDDTTISVSSADEFVFKQELANLDTVIARLQDSLRSK